MTISALFAATLSARMDYECPAVQNAIDSLAAEQWSGDRARMLANLHHYDDALLFNDIMNGWGIRSLTAATGKSREEWLKLAS
jgi:hypothetical protein